MNSQKPHIRQFAAESIGFLLRKVQNSITPIIIARCGIYTQVRNHNKLFHTMFTLVGQNPEVKTN